MNLRTVTNYSSLGAVVNRRGLCNAKKALSGKKSLVAELPGVCAFVAILGKGSRCRQCFSDENHSRGSLLHSQHASKEVVVLKGSYLNEEGPRFSCNLTSLPKDVQSSFIPAHGTEKSCCHTF